MKKIFLSQEGLEKLKSELKYLKDIKRKEIIERIQEAISYGDLTENAEYESAKNEQAFVEGRILEIEKILKSAKIISDFQDNKVSIGRRVVVENENERETFVLVDKTESDPLRGKISYNSPIGKALLGKQKGEIVEVDTPSGKIVYKIVEIE